MTDRLIRKLTTAALIVAGAISGERSVCAQDDKPIDSFEWVRIGETSDRILRMGVGYRVYERAGGPKVTLVGAVHIADPRFYKALTRRIEAHDVILFEGVGPPGSGGAEVEDLSSGEKTEWTERRIRLLAVLAEQAKSEAGAYPTSLDALASTLGDREGPWVKNASTDAWGNAISYAVKDGELSIVSAGADGKIGGGLIGQDLMLADQPPLSNSELGKEPGIQKRIADTFGLTFQLDQMETVGDRKSVV